MTVLDVNVAFLRVFEVERDDTCGQSLFSLGNGQWDIPELRRLLQGGSAGASGQRLRGHPHLRATWPPDDARQRAALGASRRDQQEASGRLRGHHRAASLGRAKDSLVSESQHRVKNFLMAVRALAQMTSTEGRSANEYREAPLSDWMLSSNLSSFQFPAIRAMSASALWSEVH
jgi:signal transduction histidine kinase